MAALLLLALGLMPAAQAMGRAERHESRHDIDQLEEAWRNAVLHRDLNALNRLLSEDFLAIMPNGLLQTKAETLAGLRNGSVRFHSIDILEHRVRFYGDTAVVTSRANVSATMPDGDISGPYRYTRVYVRDSKGRWRIVSFEASRIRLHKPHKPHR
ncbi:MAG TPA: nuclear transport factor 2 family protein [Terracidiphilus sp.]|nr:nuclear transport factor 2 family protein [Terracidiphilus sp.]